jgi:RNA polymerase sigma factor (sigma-70 family)
MSDVQNDFAALIQQVREGSQTAWHELIAVYGEHILRVVRRKMHRALRTRFDSQDFVQAVWASFIAFVPERYDFDRPEELIAFLTQMAQNKVIEAVRQRILTQKYAASREISMSLSCPAVARFEARQPTAEQILIAREEWQLLIERQPDDHQQMLLMLGGGRGQREVARELGLNEKTVYRVLRKLATQTNEPH